METTKKASYTYLHIIQILACMLVVFSHETSNFSNAIDAGNKFLPIVKVFVQVSVPLFVMKSGALLLKKEYSWTYRKLLKKMWRVGYIILFWGLTYNIISNALISGLSSDTFIVSIKSVLYADTSFNYQFWYLYMLLGLFAVTPVIKPFTDSAAKADLIYLLCFCGLIGCVLRYIADLLNLDTSGIWLIHYFPFFTGYLFYYVLGLYLSRYGLSRKSLLFVFVLVISLSFPFLIYAGKLTSAFSPYTVLFSVLLYEGLRKLDTESWHTGIKTVLCEIAELCMGVYILHPMVIVAMRKVLHIDCAIIHPVVLGVIVLGILTFILCLLCTWVMKKIPVVKNLV